MSTVHKPQDSIKSITALKHINDVSLQDEIWLHSKHYPKYYISNKGRVWSNFVNRILTGCNYRDGYIRYDIANDGTTSHIYGHVLVMLEFVSQRPDNLVIDHKDRDGKNNNLNNLHYVTPSQNSKNKENVVKNLGKPIDQFDLSGNYIRSWESLKVAASTLGYTANCIGRCCNGYVKTYMGFIWALSDLSKEDELWIDFIPSKLTVYTPLKELKTDKVNIEVSVDESTYQASDLGRIRRSDGFIYKLNTRKDERVRISLNNISLTVARVICEVFHGPPPSLDCQVNHIDENTSNNISTNLEWLTQINNVRYSNNKMIQVCDRLGEKKEYTSVHDASQDTGLSFRVIRNLCKGLKKQNPEMVFSYGDNCLGINRNLGHINAKRVIQYDLNHKFIAEYPSANEAKRITQIKSIHDCCTNRYKSAGGFIWEYAKPKMKLKMKL
jgi:hypothetical protein